MLVEMLARPPGIEALCRQRTQWSFLPDGASFQASVPPPAPVPMMITS